MTTDEVIQLLILAVAAGLILGIAALWIGVVIVL